MIDDAAPRLDVERLLSLIRRWWLVVVLGTVLAAAVAYAYSKAQPAVYQATALLYVNPGAGTVGGGDDFNEVQASWYRAGDDARTILTRPIADAALSRDGARLHHAIDAEQLLQATQAQVDAQSDVLKVTVRAADPQDTALLATAVGESFVAWNNHWRSQSATGKLAEVDQNLRRYEADLSTANLQMARLSRLGTLTAQQKALSNVLTQRMIDDNSWIGALKSTADGLRLRQSGSSDVEVLQAASVPLAPIDTHASRNVLLAAVLALLVLSALVVLADLLETARRRPMRAEAMSAGRSEVPS
jgi:uncharacterized protein involved in exopolysaccharide biosynthesis